MLHRHLALVCLCVFSLACPGKKSTPTPDPEPPPPTAGEPLVSSDEVNEAARAARTAEERERRLAQLRTTLAKKPADELWQRGEDMVAKENFKDAAEAFIALLVHHPAEARATKAAMRAMTSRFRLGSYGEGLTVAEDALSLIPDAVERARLQRVVGNAYLSIPHWGTKRGGKFLRGQWGQGQQTHRFRVDRKRAIEHLEAARAVLHEHLGQAVTVEERVAVQLDLVSAISRFTPFDSSWHHWWYAWAESADDDRVEEQGADELPGRHGRWYGGWWQQLQQHRPRGLEVTESGKIVFVERPATYDRDLGTTAKIKFLLHEVLELDTSEGKEFAAEALLRQGLLFRSRDGTERLQRLGQWWWGGTAPYKDEVEGRELFGLAEDEVLGLVATHLQVYRVPEDESFPRLMRAVQKRYPKSKAADRAGFLLGQFFQSRAQYDQAKAAYQAHVERFEDGLHVSASRAALAQLDAPELAIVEMGVQPAGRPASVNVKFRNLDKVRFEVREVDLAALTRAFQKQYRDGRTSKSWDASVPQPSQIGWYLIHDQNGALKTYAKKKLPAFTREVTRDDSGRYASARLATPLERPGLYVLEAYQDGQKNMLSRGLLLIERYAQIGKPGRQGNLMWVVDAASGAPVAGAEVEVFEYWNDWRDNGNVFRSRRRKLRSDAQGLVSLGANLRTNISIVRHQGATSYTGFGYGWGRYYPSSPGDQPSALVTTDRPVYRPGDTVQIKVWARERVSGVYRPAADVKRIKVRIHDPQGNRLQEETHTASEFGAVHIKQTLEAGAPLGMYRMDVEVDGRWTRTGGGNFRVEEYKAPEFTVTVESAGEARLGDKVPVKILGRYLFGGPVADARVRYRVYRQDYRHQYSVPGIWDWLYGIGYGRCFYIYDWLGWWHHAPVPIVWYPWWGPAPEPVRELVSEGEGRLDALGDLTFEIDTTGTQKDYGKSDHRFLIEAEVTDLSRRLIKGEGEILVTRSSYFAHVEIDRGFYFAGDQVGVHVATQKTDGSLFATEGQLLIEQVKYQGEGGATAVESAVDTLSVTTRSEAPVRMTWRAPRTGLYKFTFVGRDDKQREVRSSALAWVAGPGFHGREYRFRGLELYTDQRTYKVGDTARLLINANRENAHVLLSVRAENGYLLSPRVIQLSGKSTVIDVPIEAGDVPNFFIEALTVSDGELISEVREVFVPPTGTELGISIEGGKSEYRPGEEVELTVRTTGPDGKPLAADVALSVFDQAVLYIQSQLTPAARAHFWAVRRSHSVGGNNNLGLKFAVGERLVHPDRQAAWQLGSEAKSYEQTETDWRNGEGNLLGGDALARQAPQGQPVGGLLASAEVAANGRASAASSSRDSGRKERKAKAASTPAVPATDASKADNKLEGMRGPGRGRFDLDDDMNEDSGASAPASAKRVRRNFADTAHFAARVRTGADGLAKVRFTLPDNLTTWQVKAIGLDAETRVGEAETTLLSTKKLLLRLQAPRFFRERDRVVLSAIVHNKYTSARTAKVSLRVDDQLLAPEGATTQEVEVAANGESRVDFWVAVKGEGRASVRMDVVAGDDSDAKETSFPVLVHGLQKTVAQVDSLEMGQGPAEKTLKLEIPADRREDLSSLRIRFSPTLAGGMLDALPYLLDYPYGCTEQTLSRFVPAVLTRKALQESGGLKLGDLRGSSNLNPQELTPDGKHLPARSAREHQRFDRSPVFDQSIMDSMIRSGVRRLARMQNIDGGWGWWGRDGSSRYTTAHVVDGLLDAKSADVSLPPGMLDRGQAALQQLVAGSLYRYDQHDWVSNEDAYAAYVMSRYKAKNDKLVGYLFERRSKLTSYGKVLAALALSNLGQAEQANTLMENVEQKLREDDENQTSWIETQTDGWWYWWNNDIETNAMYLRALDQIPGQKTGDTRKRRAPRVVKWLLNHRQNGYYWRSTRDSARVIAAFAEHMRRSGEGEPDMDVEIVLDGKVLRTVHIDRSNLFTFDAEVALEGKALTTGTHELTVRRKQGKGALYFNSYLSYFSTEEDVTGAGLEVKVERTYYKLVRDDRIAEVQGDRGQKLQSRRVAYRKQRLASGAEVKSGDLILVELALTSKNDYTFLAFEDPKPAGMEPVALRSGTTYGDAVANMELRDDRVVFFLRHLHRGTLHLSYRLRAEIPGQFHAMPTNGFGMYAPELRANSDEMRVSVTDL